MRQIVLDTETTGLETSNGHRVIEIGAIEMINRRRTENTFHRYINPDREIDAAATEIHGITNEQLKDEPAFEGLADDLLEFLKGAELIIHNAAFDVGFLNNEFKRAGYRDNTIDQNCSVLDTLVMARHKHPGQKNNLDTLCKRYGVDNSQRTLHGALLDAEILADVYLQMTGGQTTLLGDSEDFTMQTKPKQVISLEILDTSGLISAEANVEELKQHQKWLALLRKENHGVAIWDKLDS